MHFKKVFEYVPLNWSKFADKFLQFSNHGIHVDVTRMQVDRSAGFSLEIPADYIFYGGSRVVTWLRGALEKLDNSLNSLFLFSHKK